MRSIRLPAATWKRLEEEAKQSWWGEFDVGPSFTLGPVSLTPMVGIAFDWAAKKAVAVMCLAR